MRGAVFNVGDIDGELGISFYEFPGAVERVDKPEAVPFLSSLVGNVRGFLAQDRNVGIVIPQQRDNATVRARVRLGERTLVGLPLDLDVAEIYIENFRAHFHHRAHVVEEPSDMADAANVLPSVVAVKAEIGVEPVARIVAVEGVIW